MRKIELMAPAGSLANLKAAISNGADAIYFGASRWSARAFASNFNKDYLPQAIRLCRANKVKAYLAMNTLVKNHELQDFFRDMEEAYRLGIDAVIIQESSFIHIIRENFPELLIHISTQAGVMNSVHANMLKADRIILARELTKDEIAVIRKQTKAELEVFVHGALCVSVSGQCLFSSLLGGRSGNRGMCAQPCRRLYDGKYNLSLKDLNLVQRIPELIELGIDAVKIEGRMRTPFYVATATAVYRKAIDSFYSGEFLVTDDMLEQLDHAFNREFTEGWFSGKAMFNREHGSGSERAVRRMYEVKDGPLPQPRKSRFIMPKLQAKEGRKLLLVRVYSVEDALAAERSGADIIYYDILAEDFADVKQRLRVPLYGATPRIFLDADTDVLEAIRKKKPAGLLAGNPAMATLGLPTHLDNNCNAFNDLDVADRFPIISPELSLKELAAFSNKDFAVFVHGKIRLMTLRHELEPQLITDETGAKFLVNKITQGTEILNGKELGLFSKSAALAKHGIQSFYIDTDKRVPEVVKYYRSVLDGKAPDDSKLKKDYVLGWAYRGVA